MSSFFTTPASQRKRKRPEGGISSSSKRRGISNSTTKSAPKQAKAKHVRDESISDGDSDSGIDAGEDYVSEDGDASSGAEDETADERRLRLAQRYLDNIREEVKEDPYAFDAADVDRDLIAERLKEDVAETKGKLHRFIADEYDFSAAQRTFFSADQNGVTGVAVILPHAFTVSSDGSIAKWELCPPAQPDDIEQDQRPSNVAIRRRPRLVKKFKPPKSPKPTYQGHTSSILCITASSSGKYLATGGTDRKIVIWDPATLKPLKVFSQHRDSVLSLSFRRGTDTLYSASADRTCKVFEVGSLAYVQTLFGHQDSVTGIAGCAGEKFVSVGARDRTARLFKVVEEQQLVFRGGGGGTKEKRKDSVNVIQLDSEEEAHSTKFAEGSIDHVALIDEETFVTGSDNGSLSLWSVLRKKPVFTMLLAHGTDEPSTLDEAYAEEHEVGASTTRPGRRKPRWITALTSIPLADIILTGSWDGHICVWRITKDRRRIERVGIVDSKNFESASMEVLTNGDAQFETTRPKPAKGVINSIAVVERATNGQFGAKTESKGVCIVATTSKTHRLGKWPLIKKEDIKGVKNGAVVFEVPRKMLEDAPADEDVSADRP